MISLELLPVVLSFFLTTQVAQADIAQICFTEIELNFCCAEAEQQLLEANVRWSVPRLTASRPLLLSYPVSPDQREPHKNGGRAS